MEENQLATRSIDLGIEPQNGPFTTEDRKLFQQLIEQWLKEHARASCGFDIALCAWQPNDGSYGKIEMLTATGLVGWDVIENDLQELQTKAKATQIVFVTYSYATIKDSDIYCLRVNDVFRSDPLVLVLQATGGKFFVNLTTWYNYVCYGKMLRFLQYAGSLLCRFRPADPVLRDSYKRTFGIDPPQFSSK